MCREHDSFFQRVMDHKSGSGCKKCGELKSRTTGIKSSMITKRNLISDFIKVHNDRYDYSKVIYTTKKSKVEIICKKHGSFLQTTSSHKSGSGCPDCKISKGESRIMNILNDFSINFKSQYRFDDCRLIYPLVFDFYLPDYNMCVEYDGIQHFEPIEKWGGIERFQKQIVNDNIKNKYCIENNIKLLRIPYTNFDKIESILDNI